MVQPIYQSLAEQRRLPSSTKAPSLEGCRRPGRRAHLLLDTILASAVPTARRPFDFSSLPLLGRLFMRFYHSDRFSHHLKWLFVLHGIPCLPLNVYGTQSRSSWWFSAPSDSSFCRHIHEIQIRIHSGHVY